MEGALHLRRAGLYPIAVQVVVDGDVVAEHRTFLDRRPLEASTAPPLSIALLASVPAAEPGTDEELTDDQRAELEALVDLAERYEGPLTVALPPATLPGLAAEAPALEDELRAALDGDELLSLPSSPLDPSSAVAVGQIDTFVRRLRDGEDALDEALPGSAAARSGWVTTTPISTGAATMLRDLAFDLLVLDEATYGQLDGNIGGFFDTTLAVDVDLGDGGSVPAMVLSPLGVLLDPGRPSADQPAATAVEILADLVITQRVLDDEQRRGVVLTAPDGRPDADVASALADDGRRARRRPTGRAVHHLRLRSTRCWSTTARRRSACRRRPGPISPPASSASSSRERRPRAPPRCSSTTSTGGGGWPSSTRSSRRRSATSRSTRPSPRSPTRPKRSAPRSSHPSPSTSRSPDARARCA